jgi:hypothetical protein
MLIRSMVQKDLRSQNKKPSDNPGMYNRTPMQVNYKSSPFDKILDITTETK